MTIDQIEAARPKILRNALDLLEEAELLLGAGRYPRAFALAHLACEEVIKLPMLVRAGLDLACGQEVDWSTLGRRIRSHKNKIRTMLLHDFVQCSDLDDDSEVEKYRKDIERIPQYDSLKNISLYSGQDGGIWIEPKEAISANLAREMCKLARNRFRYFEMMERETAGQIADAATVLGNWRELLDLFGEDGK